MDQLTLKGLKVLVKFCDDNNISDDTRVYLGDDDEVNGIHNAWGMNVINKKDKDYTTVMFLDLIEDRVGNSKPGDISIIIV